MQRQIWAYNFRVIGKFVSRQKGRQMKIKILFKVPKFVPKYVMTSFFKFFKFILKILSIFYQSTYSTFKLDEK